LLFTAFLNLQFAVICKTAAAERNLCNRAHRHSQDDLKSLQPPQRSSEKHQYFSRLAAQRPQPIDLLQACAPSLASQFDPILLTIGTFGEPNRLVLCGSVSVTGELEAARNSQWIGSSIDIGTPDRSLAPLIESMVEVSR
jgi:hypothetical protein